MRPFAAARLITSGSRTSPCSACSMPWATRAALRVYDVSPGIGAGAGDDREQAGMIGGEHGELGHAAARVESHFGRERFFRPLGGLDEARVRELVRKIDFEPIGR